MAVCALAARWSSAALVLLGLLAGVVTAAPASADEAAWSIAPADNEQGEGRPNYGYELEPGAVVEDALVVTNTGDIDLTLGVGAADGYTTAQGVLDLRPLSEVQTGVGAWLVPSTHEVTLTPGESTEVAFRLTVPEDAAPGDHTGGIVTVRTTSGGTVQLEQRLGSRIHVRVPGEQQVSLQVGDPTLDQAASLVPLAPTTATLTYTVRNDGTVRTLFTERVVLTGPGGVGRIERILDGPEVLPGSEVVRTIEVDGVRPLGWTLASIEVTPQAVDGEIGTPVVVDAGGWAIPWTTVVALLVLAGLAVAIGVRRGRRQTPSGAR